MQESNTKTLKLSSTLIQLSQIMILKTIHECNLGKRVKSMYVQTNTQTYTHLTHGNNALKQI